MIVPTRRQLALLACEWLFFTALAIIATYPLVSVAGTHLPQGVERSATVPLLNLWTMWWNVDRVSHAYQGYWNAPIYFPVPGMFAASEPQTAVGWLAWPLWRILPQPALVFNLIVLVFLTLNGWIGCRLLRALRVNWGASLCGGAMFSLLPLVHWQLGVFQLISIWGVLWTVLALVRFQRHTGPRQALQLGVAFAITYSLCCYYGLFLGMLLLVSAPILLGRQLLSRQTWLWGSIAIAVTALLLAPVVTAQLNFTRQHPIQYPAQWINDLSAAPADYLRTPSPQLVNLPVKADSAVYSWPLSPGTLKVGMAIIGFGFGVWTRRRRRVAWMMGAVAVAAILLSLGPRLQIGDVSIYRLLGEYFPGFRHARNLFRFAFFVQIAIVVLAAIGLHGVYHFLSRHRPLGNKRWLLSTVMLLLGAFLAGETWPKAPTVFPVPSGGVRGAWIDWLNAPQQANVCLAFFPQPENRTAVASQTTGEWMYFQTFHGRPMVNGYSRLVPSPIQQLGEELQHFPHREGTQALARLGVTHIVYDRRAGATADRTKLRALGMECVVDDVPAGITIWQIRAVAGKK